jgi:hypothetical protein
MLQEAKNPAVEQAATEVLSHKYSNQKKPTNREISAKMYVPCSLTKHQPNQIENEKLSWNM